MAKIVIYTTEHCPFCVRAKQLLHNKGVAYTELRVDEQPELRAEMEAMTGHHTVPQIFINDQLIGGWDDLIALENGGYLDSLLNKE